MTVRFPLTRDAWVDLGAAPLSVVLASVSRAFVVPGTAPPPVASEEAQILFQDGNKKDIFGVPGQRVYARAVDTTAAVWALPVAAAVSSGGKVSYTLLSAASTTGAASTNIAGGNYVWRVEGTFGGATATLQVLGLDGTTWTNAKDADGTTDITATAARSKAVTVAQGTAVRVAIAGGSGVSLNSTLGGY